MANFEGKAYITEANDSHVLVEDDIAKQKCAPEIFQKCVYEIQLKKSVLIFGQKEFFWYKKIQMD